MQRLQQQSKPPWTLWTERNPNSVRQTIALKGTITSKRTERTNERTQKRQQTLYPQSRRCNDICYIYCKRSVFNQQFKRYYFQFCSTSSLSSKSIHTQTQKFATQFRPFLPSSSSFLYKLRKQWENAVSYRRPIKVDPPEIERERERAKKEYKEFKMGKRSKLSLGASRLNKLDSTRLGWFGCRDDLSKKYKKITSIFPYCEFEL